MAFAVEDQDAGIAQFLQFTAKRLVRGFADRADLGDNAVEFVVTKFGAGDGAVMCAALDGPKANVKLRLP